MSVIRVVSNGNTDAVNLYIELAETANIIDIWHLVIERFIFWLMDYFVRINLISMGHVLHYFVGTKPCS